MKSLELLVVYPWSGSLIVTRLEWALLRDKFCYFVLKRKFSDLSTTHVPWVPVQCTITGHAMSPKCNLLKFLRNSQSVLDYPNLHFLCEKVSYRNSPSCRGGDAGGMMHHLSLKMPVLENTSSTSTLWNPIWDTWKDHGEVTCEEAIITPSIYKFWSRTS